MKSIYYVIYLISVYSLGLNASNIYGNYGLNCTTWTYIPVNNKAHVPGIGGHVRIALMELTKAKNKSMERARNATLTVQKIQPKRPSAVTRICHWVGVTTHAEVTNTITRAMAYLIS
ncbi:hypothetical protein CROQUDRAFT_708305 [Cronartium quercuum f. sp. fusiforme G11]|uniref:Uncharacterized protein n=1 Tax=Cronartium quercuum f. sp. fusiforme G11 TaxID=708437 RepID=A0A9P6TAL8_9BASI|nr:hypothetical protein CROQUDRAFT_708305 [Cronartium quercuum f. sp. fusiforme G11]